MAQQNYSDQFMADRIGITMRVGQAAGSGESRDCLAQDWARYMAALAPAQCAAAALLQQLHPAAYAENRQRVAHGVIDHSVLGFVAKGTSAEVIAAGQNKSIELPMLDEFRH